MSKIRQRKVATEIARIISQLLVSEAKDHRFTLATVSEVEMSPDLGFAKVYIFVQSSFSYEDEEITQNRSDKTRYAKEVIEALNQAATWFQQGLAKELRLRKIPKITFLVDNSADQYAEIDALLRKALYE